MAFNSQYLSNSDDLYSFYLNKTKKSKPKFRIASPRNSYLEAFNIDSFNRIEKYDPYNSNLSKRTDFLNTNAINRDTPDIFVSQDYYYASEKNVPNPKTEFEKRIVDQRYDVSEPEIMKMYLNSRKFNIDDGIISADSSLETVKSFELKTIPLKKHTSNDYLHSWAAGNKKKDGYLGHFKETFHRNNNEKNTNKYTYKEYKKFKDNAGFGLDFLDKTHDRETTEIKLEKVQKRNEYSNYVKQRNFMKENQRSLPNFDYLPDLKSKRINKVCQKHKI